jgi:hypothetical protein
MLSFAPALTVGPLMAADWPARRSTDRRTTAAHHHHHHVLMSFMSGGRTIQETTWYRYEAPGGTSTLAITVGVAGPAVQVLARLEEA